MIPKELNWNHALSQATLPALCIPLCWLWGCKTSCGAEYFQNQGNDLEIWLGQTLCPAVSPGKSSLRKGFGLKFGFILSYLLVLGCLCIQTCVSLELIVPKTFPLWFSYLGRKQGWCGIWGAWSIIFYVNYGGVF